MDGQAFEELYDKAKKTEYKKKQLRKEKDKKEKEELKFKPEINKHSVELVNARLVAFVKPPLENGKQGSDFFPKTNYMLGNLNETTRSVSF